MFLFFFGTLYRIYFEIEFNERLFFRLFKFGKILSSKTVLNYLLKLGTFILIKVKLTSCCLTLT